MLKKLLQVIFFVLLFIIINRATYFLINYTSFNEENKTYISKIIFGIIISSYSIYAIRYFRFNYLVGISRPSFIYLWLYLCPLYIIFLLDLTNLSNLKIYQLILPFTSVFLHAFAEELTIRGIILPTLINNGHITEKSVKNSVIISALIFGLVHFISFADYDLGSVLAQITYATIHGLFFGILLIKGRNIYLLALCHALINFFNRIKHINQPAYEPLDTGNSQSILLTILLTILLFSPLIVISIFYIKKIGSPDIIRIKEFLPVK